MVRMRTAIVALSVLAAVTLVRADDGRLQSAADTLKELTANGDTGIPGDLLAKARCVAIIPSVKKAALGIGGQYGRGYILCRREGGGWSAPGGLRIEGGSVGLQIGASGTDVVLVVLNDRGADRLLASKFTVGADAAVAAGPVGRQAQAQTDITLRAEILAWSRSHGLFAGISLQGSTLREDSGENKDLYGKTITNKDIVRGTIAPPSAAAALMAVLAKF